MNYIQLGDGTIVFKRRGNPPEEIAGYEADPNDPYIFRPKFCKCVHRVNKDILLPCKKIINKPYCVILELPVVPDYCNQCQLDKG